MRLQDATAVVAATETMKQWKKANENSSHNFDGLVFFCKQIDQLSNDKST